MRRSPPAGRSTTPRRPPSRRLFTRAAARQPFHQRRRARRARRRTSTDNNTWAAYQCYGDPDWVFRRDGGDAMSPPPRPEDEFAGVASARGIEPGARNHRRPDEVPGLQAGIAARARAHARETVRQRWGGIGAVAELFGAAYVAGRDIASAIRWYERAVAADDGTASMNAVEQLANVRVRLAWETVEKAQHDRDRSAARLKAAGAGRRAADRKARAAAKRSLAAAERALRRSLVSARSSIRDAIALLEKAGGGPADDGAREPLRIRIQAPGARRGGCRPAGRGTAGDRSDEDAITSAPSRSAREREASNVFYPGLNYLAAELALNTGRRGWKGVDASIVEATGKSLDAERLADPDFWSVVGQTELRLYKALAGTAGARERARLDRAWLPGSPQTRRARRGCGRRCTTTRASCCRSTRRGRRGEKGRRPRRCWSRLATFARPGSDGTHRSSWSLSNEMSRSQTTIRISASSDESFVGSFSDAFDDLMVVSKACEDASSESAVYGFGTRSVALIIALPLAT